MNSSQLFSATQNLFSRTNKVHQESELKQESAKHELSAYIREEETFWVKNNLKIDGILSYFFREVPGQGRKYTVCLDGKTYYESLQHEAAKRAYQDFGGNSNETWMWKIYGNKKSSFEQLKEAVRLLSNHLNLLLKNLDDYKSSLDSIDAKSVNVKDLSQELQCKLVLIEFGVQEFKQLFASLAGIPGLHFIVSPFKKTFLRFEKNLNELAECLFNKPLLELTDSLKCLAERSDDQVREVLINISSELYEVCDSTLKQRINEQKMVNFEIVNMIRLNYRQQQKRHEIKNSPFRKKFIGRRF